ncbi:MAG: hypothetical protein IPJ13_28060 [Saprospiraceae bacterium]|nr:hypothetical protein [Saprospiraceae bacterium]
MTKHSYDHQGRKKYDHINLNGTGERTLAECNYDHKNQIIERNLGRHATTGTHQYLQSLDYTYNAQGWLTQINQPTPYYGPEIDPCLFLNKGLRSPRRKVLLPILMILTSFTLSSTMICGQWAAVSRPIKWQHHNDVMGTSVPNKWNFGI